MARLIVQRVKAAPRVALGAVLAAIVAGIGGNALLMQAGRHPAPLFAPAAQSSAAAVEPVAPHAPPVANPAPKTAQAVTPQPSAPATTASIEPAAKVDRPASAPSPAPAAPGRVEKRPAAPDSDPIGAILRGKPVDDGSHLVRAAQVALAKLGYPVKPGGAEDRATRRALRHFQHAHGLPETAEISPELVKRLNAASRAER